MINAIILSRVSTVGQDLEQQTNDLWHDAEYNGFSKDNVLLIEDKESAIKLAEDERNGLNEMKRAIETGNIKAVFVWEITRISRQLPMLYSIRDYLQKHKVQLYCHAPQFKLFNDDWTISDVSNMVFAMFAVLAENEMKVKKERFARGKAKAKAEGKALGKPAFGYKVGKHKYIEPDEDESQIVKEMIKTYIAENISYHGLAIKLHNNGTFGDMPINSIIGKINNIFNNDAYIGRKPYPAIISTEQWNLLHQTMLERKAAARTHFKGEKRVALCKGIVYMKGTDYLLGVGGDYYISRGIRHNKPLGMPSIRIEMLDPIAFGVAVELSKEAESQYAVREKLENKEKELHSCKLLCVARMKDLQDKIDLLEERIILGKLSASKAEQLETSLSKQYETEKQTMLKYENDIKHINEQISALYNNEELDYSNMSDEDKSALIHKYIKVINIMREHRYQLYIDIIDIYGNVHKFKCDTNRYARYKDEVEKIS